MGLSIRTKLFLVFLLTTAVVMSSILIFVHWSIERGFVQYVEKRQAQDIARISERLLDIYATEGSWKGLARDKRRWLLILFGRYIPTVHHPPGWERHQPNHPLQRLILRLLKDNSSQWPPERNIRQIKQGDRPLPAALRLMLFGADGMPIYGRRDMLKNSQRFPLRLDGVEVGYLALIPGPSLTETLEIRFLEEQRTGLLLIALGVVFLSALISMLLAKRLVKPITAFRTATHRLASGQYDTRVSVDRTDELGQLATDINELGKSLQASERARQQWVADIAHELRTPLSVIRGELEALQDGVRQLDSRAIESLMADTLRLGRLVDDLYQLSMTDSGALSYRKEQCHPIKILSDDINSLVDRFAEADIELTVDIDSALPITMLADVQRLSQMYRNILQNSLRYTDHGGKLHVQATKQGQTVIIDFQDSEPGVDEQHIAKLFDRLYRVEVSRNRELGGAGLGLAIVKNIVIAHSGEISAMKSPLGGLWVQISFSLLETEI